MGAWRAFCLFRLNVTRRGARARPVRTSSCAPPHAFSFLSSSPPRLVAPRAPPPWWRRGRLTRSSRGVAPAEWRGGAQTPPPPPLLSGRQITIHQPPPSPAGTGEVWYTRASGMSGAGRRGTAASAVAAAAVPEAPPSAADSGRRRQGTHRRGQRRGDCRHGRQGRADTDGKGRAAPVRRAGCAQPPPTAARDVSCSGGGGGDGGGATSASPSGEQGGRQPPGGSGSRQGEAAPRRRWLAARPQWQRRRCGMAAAAAPVAAPAAAPATMRLRRLRQVSGDGGSRRDAAAAVRRPRPRRVSGERGSRRGPTALHRSWLAACPSRQRWRPRRGAAAAAVPGGATSAPPSGERGRLRPSRQVKATPASLAGVRPPATIHKARTLVARAAPPSLSTLPAYSRNNGTGPLATDYPTTTTIAPP